jgi:hypothetical protein
MVMGFPFYLDFTDILIFVNTKQITYRFNLQALGIQLTFRTLDL